LHVFNPDEYIVRSNVRLMQEGRMFDSDYAGELSDDAVPALLESLPALNFERQCIVKYTLGDRLKKAQTENDIRTWNLSRWKARRELSAYADSLDTTGCPSYGKRYSEED
jgi:predicted metallo-beta-lactamase superfamily hydrolase